MARRPSRITSLLLGLSIPVSMIATSGPAVSAGKPNLVVGGLRGAPAAAPGSTFEVASTIKNTGTARAGRSTTRFYLSEDGRRDVLDRLMEATARVPALDPGKSKKSRVSVAVPADVSDGLYRLIACADALRRVSESKESDNCRSISLRVVTPSTSDDLISEALEGGSITEEEATIYRVFAAFDPNRLPNNLKGTPSIARDSDALDAAADVWDTLSEEARVELGPYLIPAYLEGSWYGPNHDGARSSAARAAGVVNPANVCEAIATGGVRKDWAFIEAVGGGSGDKIFRIWFQKTRTGDEATATKVAMALEQDIYPKLNAMFPEPPGDKGGKCQGESTAYDIVLIRGTDVYGAVKFLSWMNDPPGSGCPPYLSYAYIDISKGYLRPTVAHELFHSSIAAQPKVAQCLDYSWMNEATATWMEHHVYPNGIDAPDGKPKHSEQIYSPEFMANPAVTLPEYKLDSAGDAVGTHHYSAYLWFFFVDEFLGDHAYPERVWEATANQTAVGALHTNIKGMSFKEAWAKFALHNWNRTPYDFYEKNDGLNDRAALTEDSTITMAGETGSIPIEIGGSLPPLSARYYRFGFPDRSAKRITIENLAPAGDEIQVQILAKIEDGDWIEPKLAEPKVGFCRDLDAELLEELVVIVSRAAPASDDGDLDLKDRVRVTAADECLALPERWTGTFSGSADSSGESPSHAEWSGTVTFGRTDFDGQSFYRVESGHGESSDGDLSCSVSFNDGDGYLELKPAEPGAAAPYWYDGFGFYQGGTPCFFGPSGGDWWIPYEEVEIPVSARMYPSITNGQWVIQGSKTYTSENYSVTFNWNFAGETPTERR